MAHRTRSILPLGRDGNKVVVDYTLPPYVRTPTLTREQMERNLAILRSLEVAAEHNVVDDTIPPSVSAPTPTREQQVNSNRAILRSIAAERQARDAAAETSRARIQPAICGGSQASPTAGDSVRAPFAFGESRGAEERIAAETQTEPSDSEMPSGDLNGSDSEGSEEHAVAPETPKTHGTSPAIVDPTSETSGFDEKRFKVKDTPKLEKPEPQTPTAGDNAEHQGLPSLRLDIVRRPDAAMCAELAKLLRAKADELRDQMDIVVAEGGRVREAQKLENKKVAKKKKAQEYVEKTLLKVESLLDEAILEKEKESDD